MYQTTVNNKSFEIIATEDGFSVNGQAFQWDVQKIADGYFHVIQQHKSYKAELVKADYATKTFHFKINGKTCQVEVKDKFDLLLEKMGLNNSTSGKINSIKAPMPGLIIDLKITQGDIVKAGDPLLILEAMKMENIIKSPCDGTVKTVHVKKGASVEKNQILIEF